VNDDDHYVTTRCNPYRVASLCFRFSR